MNKPNILDRSFKYTPSAKTDISKTFARIRKEIKTQEKESNCPILNPNGFVLSAQWFEME